jgi:formate dehydrogenase (coenzyme F420) beta subunit
MDSAFHNRIEQLLAETNVLGVLGLRGEDGWVTPYVFTSVVETDRLVLEPKWPLAKAAWRMARSLEEGTSLGLVCRGCDIRAIEELVKAGQLKPGVVRTVGLPCSAEQSAACLCETPFPPGEESSTGIDSVPLGTVPQLCLEPGRLELWQQHFQRCIKCYGCRNACPICVCPSCKLEDDEYSSLGMVPPEPLAFHLIRAMHLADRCVGCGACQESCPSGLPLLALHLAVRKALRERTGYVSGTPAVSPLLTAGREEGVASAGVVEPFWEDTLGNCPSGGGEHAE